MSDREPVSQWIERIKAGDQEAAAKIWKQYYDKLIRLACRRMRGARRRVADEEDVVARAFETFFRRAQEKEFPDLNDGSDLWQVLVTITDQNAKNFLRAERSQKRGGGHVRGESGFQGNIKDKKRVPDQTSKVGSGADQYAGDEPTPEFSAMLVESFEELLDRLDDDHREVALLKLEGFSHDEISRKIGRSVRTVDRRLGIIREKWKDNGSD